MCEYYPGETQHGLGKRDLHTGEEIIARTFKRLVRTSFQHKDNVAGGDSGLWQLSNKAILSERDNEDLKPKHTSWSPAPARTILCRSVIPFSTKISCRVFSLIVFEPLHFLHLGHINFRTQDCSGLFRRSSLPVFLSQLLSSPFTIMAGSSHVARSAWRDLATRKPADPRRQLTRFPYLAFYECPSFAFAG